MTVKIENNLESEEDFTPDFEIELTKNVQKLPRGRPKSAARKGNILPNFRERSGINKDRSANTGDEDFIINEVNS